ncbi:MAG: ParB/RepB/Spo0J family partition protein [Bacteroidales bacterium]|nr:ParB/RepB/Spo0J family partition protein [Bacteroidales bacterium]
MTKKQALGRGLGALIADAPAADNRPAPEQSEPTAASGVVEIDVELIDLNPFQPRQHFDEEALAELAASIEKIGIVQPITASRNDDGRYRLIAGERRLRAAKLAGLKAIPAFIRTADDQGLLEMGLVENIQREDLNAIEVAISYQRLIDECQLTQEQLSERVGKKRATIANYLRLLKLQGEVQKALIDKKIDMGHAKALLSLDQPRLQVMALKRIVDGGLSVRKTEELVKQMAAERPAPKPRPSLEQAEEYLRSHLVNTLGLRADVKPGTKGDGKIVISYNNPEELEMIVEKFDKFKE